MILHRSVHLAFSKTGRLLKGGSLTLRYLDLPPTSHYVFYIYCCPFAIYAKATLDGDIGLFLRKTNKSVPLSLSFLSVSLSICEGPLGLCHVKDVLRALRYHFRDPVPLQILAE